MLHECDLYFFYFLFQSHNLFQSQLRHNPGRRILRSVPRQVPLVLWLKYLWNICNKSALHKVAVHIIRLCTLFLCTYCICIVSVCVLYTVKATYFLLLYCKIGAQTRLYQLMSVLLFSVPNGVLNFWFDLIYFQLLFQIVHVLQADVLWSMGHTGTEKV